MMDIIEHAIALSSEEYPVGSFGLGLPVNAIGVWKQMDGIENFHPGSGIDYRSVSSNFFERVA